MITAVETIRYNGDFRNSSIEFKDNCYIITIDAIECTEDCDNNIEFSLFI